MGTWLKLLIYILPSTLDREGISRKEYGITSKGSHQSVIPPLHIAQIFCQIYEFVDLDINPELLEASKICRQFTCEIIFLKVDIHNIICCNGIIQEIIRDVTSEDSFI